MKKLLIVLVIGFALFAFIEKNPGFIQPHFQNSILDDQQVSRAYESRQSDVQVAGSGVVVRNLPDDTKGSRHQKFLLKLTSGQTLLVAHNIDLAPRINSLREGDSIEFFGEYEWNPKGGVLHWTHRDPGGRHQDGWLKHDGTTYQ